MYYLGSEKSLRLAISYGIGGTFNFAIQVLLRLLKFKYLIFFVVLVGFSIRGCISKKELFDDIVIFKYGVNNL
jgi:hypothetical protein